MRSIYDIAEFVNDLIVGTIPGAKVYGIAKSATRDGLIMPVENDKYIGLDDTFPAMAYHKHLNIVTDFVPGSGYGDDESFIRNSHQMAVVLYFNEKKCGIKAEDFYTLLQVQLTGPIKWQHYRSVRLAVINVNLNDAQVWSQEYGAAEFRLPAGQRLIQIGYNVAMTLSQHCIEIPKCKN